MDKKLFSDKVHVNLNVQKYRGCSNFGLVNWYAWTSYTRNEESP